MPTILTPTKFNKTIHGTTPPSRRTGIVIHHSVTAEGGSQAGVEAILRGINRQHPNGSYNYAVDYAGRIYEIVGLNNIGGHAYLANTANWGVCYIGDGRYNFTAAAEASIRELCIWLQAQAGKHVPVMGHQDVPRNRTACPGGIIEARVKAGAFGSAYTGPATGGGSGKSTAQIKAYQQLLIAKGYDLGSWGADGKHGKMTDAAVRAFQKANGLVVDGIVGPVTQAALLGKPIPAAPAAPASGGRRMLRVGTRGSDVSAWQRFLKENYPLYASGLVIDGIFGPATKRATAEFQRRSGITADGIVGPVTRAKSGT